MTEEKITPAEVAAPALSVVTGSEMLKSRKASCFGCRAYYQLARGPSCHLNYSQEVKKQTRWLTTYGPSEPCPRPLTNDALITAPNRSLFPNQP